MTYNQIYAKTVKPRYKEDYSKGAVAIITKDKAQVNLLKKRHKNHVLYEVNQVYKFIIIEL